jgi:DNA polymerase III alpha subunit
MPAVRTGYSFRVAVGHIADVLSRLKEVGSSTAPIADRVSTFGYTKWTKAARKEGLRPIYGVEIGVAMSLGEKRQTLDFWNFFAKDDIAALHELIYTATSQTGREPHLSFEYAQSFPGVVKIAGERAFIEKLNPKAPDLYIALSPATPKGLVTEAKKRGFKFIAANQNFYPREDDLEFYRVTLGTRFSGTQTYPMHILSEEEWHAATEWQADLQTRKSALANWKKVEKQCTASLKKATLLKPEKAKSLRQMCIDAAPALKINLRDPVYKARLDKELRLIDEKKFEDYFYIIADMVNWAKERMVCGPARGSSCGSLVCYLLGITAIDPIPYDLLFERFIDTTRSDLPDIDLDFSDQRRGEVFKYVEDKYGRDRVARLGTVGMFKPKSALNQAGLALQIPRWEIDRVGDNIIDRSSGDSRALQALEDTLKDTEAGRNLLAKHPEVLIAGRMEGHPNVPSQHAAGVLITEEPVNNYVAVDARTKASMCDKKDAEELNLLKIDALGLIQLSIFERTMELIGKGLNKAGLARSGWLETIPLNDPAAFDVLKKGHFAGIFQFMGGALQSLAKQTDFNHINDIIAITALARPGPMATGGANQWVRRRAGAEAVTYPHPLLEPYMRETLGIVVYQEQVMQIGREVGDLTWEQVTALRKAMSKSLGEEFFNQFGDPWKNAAMKKGMPADIADSFWKDLCAFGSWGFNKSHAVAYGTVSYWCCWLKAHHPVEFAAATLDAHKEPMKQTKLLRELAAEGIGYVPIDPDRSTARWEPAVLPDGKRVVVGPLTNIKGIGPAAVREILSARKDGKSVKPGIAKKLASATTGIDDLYPIAARVRLLHPDIKASAKIFSEVQKIIDVQPPEVSSALVIGVARRIVPRDENEPVNIAKREERAKKRGQKTAGRSFVQKGKQTRYLNLFIQDDTDEILVRIDRYDYDRLGLPIVERGRAGKAIYAFKGSVPAGFRMIHATQAKYLGDLEEFGEEYEMTLQIEEEANEPNED